MSDPFQPHAIAKALFDKAEELGLESPTEAMVAECILDCQMNAVNFPAKVLDFDSEDMTPESIEACTRATERFYKAIDELQKHEKLTEEEA